MRQSRVCITVHPVQNDSPGPLQEPVFFFKTCIIYLPTDAEPLRLYPLQDIRPSFRPAVFRKHRIQHHRSVVVKGHPVVRKYGIRSMRYRGILHRYYLYAVCTQLIHHAPKFLQGTSLYCFTCRNCPLLEIIVGRCFFIEPEGHGQQSAHLRYFIIRYTLYRHSPYLFHKGIQADKVLFRNHYLRRDGKDIRIHIVHLFPRYFKYILPAEQIEQSMIILRIHKSVLINNRMPFPYRHKGTIQMQNPRTWICIMFFQLQGDEYLPRTDFFQKGKSIPVGTCRLHLRVIGLGIKAYKH